MDNQNSGVLGVFNAAADKLSQVKDYLATAGLDIGGRVATGITEMSVHMGVGGAAIAALQVPVFMAVGDGAMSGLGMAAFFTAIAGLPVGMGINNLIGFDVERIGDHVQGYFDRKYDDYIEKHQPTALYDSFDFRP